MALYPNILNPGKISRFLNKKNYLSLIFLSLIFLPGEIRLFETFSTYKIFTLELISVYCSIRVILNKIKKEIIVSF